MQNETAAPGLSGRHVLIPGGTGGVGEGAVRAYLAAGADVVVPTRSQERADEFRRLLGDAVTSHLHLVVHDYTTFAGAEALAAQISDPFQRAGLEWVALKSAPDRDHLIAFEAAHKDWPAADWMRDMREGWLYSERAPAATVEALFAHDPPHPVQLRFPGNGASGAAAEQNVLLAHESMREGLRIRATPVPDLHCEHNATLPRIFVEHDFHRRIGINTAVPIILAVDLDSGKAGRNGA